MTSSQSDVTPLAPGEVRVPVCTVGPSPKAFAKAVWEFVRGVKAATFIDRFRRSTGQPGHEDSTGLDAMAFAPVALHETGAVHVFDKHGFRLQRSAELSLALPWSEVHRVALQVQHSQILGLRMLRVAFWPAYPQTFPRPTRSAYACGIRPSRAMHWPWSRRPRSPGPPLI